MKISIVLEAKKMEIGTDIAVIVSKVYYLRNLWLWAQNKYKIQYKTNFIWITNPG